MLSFFHKNMALFTTRDLDDKFFKLCDAMPKPAGFELRDILTSLPLASDKARVARISSLIRDFETIDRSDSGDKWVQVSLHFADLLESL